MLKFFKNILLLLTFLFVLNLDNTYADGKINVTLSKCVDGDTAYFIVDNKEVKVRFLAIDTPESTNKIEPYGKQASEFVCKTMRNAKKIELEYDGDKVDKYGRTLAWVFVDDELLQNIIVKNGLAEVTYLYDDYKYTDMLKDSERIAKQKKLNIWEDYKSNYIITAISIVILFIFSQKFRKKVKRKVKSKVNKKINDGMDKLLK